MTRKEAEPEARDLRPIGLLVFLAGLTTLLGASLVGYLVVRIRADVWPPKGMPEIPSTLWLSTFILFVSSFTMHRAMKAAARGDQSVLVNGLILTILLAVTFLASQIACGLALFEAATGNVKEVYSFTFVMLTSLHAVHVIGGFFPLGFSLRSARRGRYTPDDHVGMKLTATYWHFLFAVWLVMFVALLV